MSVHARKAFAHHQRIVLRPKLWMARHGGHVGARAKRNDCWFLRTVILASKVGTTPMPPSVERPLSPKAENMMHMEQLDRLPSPKRETRTPPKSRPVREEMYSVC